MVAGDDHRLSNNGAREVRNAIGTPIILRVKCAILNISLARWCSIEVATNQWPYGIAQGKI